MNGRRPIRETPELADFFADGVEAHIPATRLQRMSLIGRIATGLGLGAMVTFLPTDTSEDPRPMPPRDVAPLLVEAPPLDLLPTVEILKPSIQGGAVVPPLPESIQAPMLTAYTQAHGAAQAPDGEDRVDFNGIRVPLSIAQTILNAAKATGADPVVMMAIADKESSFDVDAKARTSTATGLYQFVEQSWLEAVRDFGAKHGMEEDAKAVKTERGGRVYVDDPVQLRGILDKRKDPALAALMACERTLAASATVKKRVGADLSRGEIYMTHLMGTNGAGKLIETVATEPNRSSASVFPKAAASNRALFYKGRAKPLTTLELHGRISGQLETRIKRYESVEEKVDVSRVGMAMR